MYVRNKKTSTMLKPKFIIFIIIIVLLAFLINTFINSFNAKLTKSHLVDTINTEINLINKDSSMPKNNESNLSRLDKLIKTKDTLLNKSNDENTNSMLHDLSDSPKKIQNIITFGYKYIGYPYVFGANGPDAFDCSSFVQYVFSEFNIDLPRVTYDQVSVGKKVKPSKLKPGDLVFTEGTVKKPEHVGIYIGGGQMIHASQSNSSIVVSPVYQFITARRIL